MVPFPDAGVSVATGWSRRGSTGLLLYRITQATGLLDFPDFSEGDFGREARREALRRHVVFQQPLTALALFLGVVALEDYVRDFGARLSTQNDFLNVAPGLGDLGSIPAAKKQLRMFDRIDRDSFNPIDPEAANRAFQHALGIQVIASTEHAKLRDLALLRHTVAHHAAVIRPIDVSRFQYYSVEPGASINPPPEFVTEIVQYLWRIARGVEIRVRNKLLELARPTWPVDWRSARAPEAIRFIEFFEHFGHIESARIPVRVLPETEPERSRAIEERVRIEDALLHSCFSEIETPSADSIPPI